MKKLILVTVMLVAVGCKGPAGSNGSNGAQGPQGTPGLNGPTEVVLSGPVTSDLFTITDARIKLASNVSVFLNNGTTLIESPYYLPGYATNTFYLLNPTAGTIQFYNAAKASATGYIVVLMI